jgi:hypothetical protein
VIDCRRSSCGASDREGEALCRWLRAEMTVPLGRGRPQQERRADQIGCGVVPCAKLGALTSKAGMSFFFMGIMLATPPSIKDSGCDPRGGTARPRPQRKRHCGTPWDQAGTVAEGPEAKAGRFKKTGG